MSFPRWGSSRWGGGLLVFERWIIICDTAFKLRYTISFIIRPDLDLDAVTSHLIPTEFVTVSGLIDEYVHELDAISEKTETFSGDLCHVDLHHSILLLLTLCQHNNILALKVKKQEKSQNVDDRPTTKTVWAQ